MNISINWFDDISPTESYHLKPSEGSRFLRNYKFGNFSKKRNLRITPSCTPKKLKLQNTSSIVVKGNCAPPTPIITNNMMRAYVVKGYEMCQYFKLIDEDSIIKRFLEMDQCFLFADKYFLAMVFAHFKRCNFTLDEYTRTNFFLCLYLVHDIEEDNEDLKYEIFPWTLGPYWRNNISHFLLKKDELWARMNYRAIVSKKCCEELMSIFPNHIAWQRERQPHHGGAIRNYKKDIKLAVPRGPNLSPKTCTKCNPEKLMSQISNSLHDSAFSSLWECDSNDEEVGESDRNNNSNDNILNQIPTSDVDDSDIGVLNYNDDNDDNNIDNYNPLTDSNKLMDLRQQFNETCYGQSMDYNKSED